MIIILRRLLIKIRYVYFRIGKWKKNQLPDLMWWPQFRVRQILTFLRIPAITARKGLENCDIYVLNLAHRTDRMLEFESEMNKLRVPGFLRIEAVYTPQEGLVGAALSHSLALQHWLNSGSKSFAMICEDDAMFSGSRSEVDNAIGDFANNTSLDVLSLAFNTASPPKPLSEALSLTSNTRSCSCYVVNKRAARRLIGTFTNSAARMSGGEPHHKAALDILWQLDQKLRLSFAVPSTRLVRQRPSFSDISNVFVDRTV